MSCIPAKQQALGLVQREEEDVRRRERGSSARQNQPTGWNALIACCRSYFSAASVLFLSRTTICQRPEGVPSAFTFGGVNVLISV